MQYETVKGYTPEAFLRLTGVKPATFKKMLDILKEAEVKKNEKGGKPNKLEMEDRLLMALEYEREYRTFFHIASDYGVSESTCYRNIIWIEDTLIKHKDFALPGSKALSRRKEEYTEVMMDATETPIERPKKTKNSTIQAKRKTIL
jgi:hypothetical protein